MTLSKKLNGYKQQDKRHKIYSDFYFITKEQVLEKLKECEKTCLYCKCQVLMEYTSRDPKQWTLDRIDNTMGHNTSNVVISCLECNLKRRNISVEKFTFTKQLKINKVV
jgi:hypothetical protein